VTLIVDGANVMGSRADGWWRDRAGAMARLHGELVVLAAHGIPVPPPGGAHAVPRGADPAGTTPAGTTPAGTTPAGTTPAGTTPGGTAPAGAGQPGEPVLPWFPHILLVVEGKSRAAARLVTADLRVELVHAPGEGDDEIARLAGSVAGRRIVITADQRLRDRCLRAGAEVAGPRWLTGLLA
jgi:hypothetical protein